MRSRRSSACLRLAVLLIASAFLAVFGAAPAAQAGSIAYVDQNEVWVSSFDGTQKARLSAGEGDWRQVTTADNGRVLGVRLEAGKVSQLSTIRLWGSDGQTISEGPLPFNTLVGGWSSYVAPLGLDLSADGVFLAYGYSGYRSGAPPSWFSGHNVVNSDVKTNITPIGQAGYEWPTMFGRQVVAKSGNSAVFQPAGDGPFGNTFTPLIDVSGTGLTLQRTDVAATGRLAAIDLDGATDKIAVVSLSGMTAGAAVGDTVNCFLPAAGSADDATFSQDGQFIVWQDSEGVKIAGVPTTAADPCVFSSPPVLISATGSSPSIGGSNVRTLRPGPPPPGGGTDDTPGGGTDDAPTSKPLIVTLPAKVTAAALTSKAGLTLKVTVPAGGKITVTASVPASRLGLKGKKAVVIATGSASPRSAGQVSFKLRLNAKGRKYRKRLPGLTLTLRITQGAKTTTKTFRLR